MSKHMGRIKTQLIKRITNELVRKHPDDIKDEFNNNKHFVEEFTTVKSKKIRNVIAGYVTRLVRNRE